MYMQLPIVNVYRFAVLSCDEEEAAQHIHQCKQKYEAMFLLITTCRQQVTTIFRDDLEAANA